MLSFSHVHVCVIIYVIIFKALAFLISFDVIIFHGQQMLSFIVIMTFTSWKIITSSTPKKDNIFYNQKDNIKEFKNDNIYTMKNDNIPYTWKR